MNSDTELLDRLIPLRGASHADVIAYATDIPMRYTECRATLADGRVVRLKNPRQFAGWSDSGTTLNLLFTGADRHVEIAVERAARERLKDITCWRLSDRKPNGNARYFVARDGSRFAIELAERLAPVPTRDAAPARITPSMDPYPEWLACRNRAAGSTTH
jgi:hypothetical protein